MGKKILTNLLIVFFILLSLSISVNAKIDSTALCSASTQTCISIMNVASYYTYIYCHYIEGIYGSVECIHQLNFVISLDWNTNNDDIGAILTDVYSYPWLDSWFPDLSRYPHKYDPIKIAYCDYGNDGQYGLTANYWNLWLDNGNPINGNDYFPVNFINSIPDYDYPSFTLDKSEYVYGEASIQQEFQSEYETYKPGFDGCISYNITKGVTCHLYLNPYYTEIVKTKAHFYFDDIIDILGGDSMFFFNICDSSTDLCDIYFSKTFYYDYYGDSDDCIQSDDNSYTIINLNNTVEKGIRPQNNEDESIPEKENQDDNGKLPTKGNIAIDNIIKANTYKQMIEQKTNVAANILDIIKGIFAIYLILFMLFEFWVIIYFFGTLLTSIPRKIMEIARRSGKGL